jgi:hypothetical protein
MIVHIEEKNIPLNPPSKGDLSEANQEIGGPREDGAGGTPAVTGEEDGNLSALAGGGNLDGPVGASEKENEAMKDTELKALLDGARDEGHAAGLEAGRIAAETAASDAVASAKADATETERGRCVSLLEEFGDLDAGFAAEQIKAGTGTDAALAAWGRKSLEAARLAPKGGAAAAVAGAVGVAPLAVAPEAAVEVPGAGPGTIPERAKALHAANPEKSISWAYESLRKSDPEAYDAWRTGGE